ncbi:MAG: hypothetical protein IT426_08330 [Pirellulales bacterium]|nr:hypothetical protein [Pirellulales bacterium]
MESPLIIRGKFTHQTFVPDGLLPEVEGPAELIVYVRPAQDETKSAASLFDLIGKAPVLRSAEDLEIQIRKEKQAWDEE